MNYTIQDLLTNQSFLNYYFKNNEEDMLDWEEWQEDNKERQMLVKEAFSLLDKLSLKWSKEEIQLRWVELSNELGLENAPSTKRVALNVRRRLFLWGSAAAVLLLLCGIWYFFNPKLNLSQQVVDNEWIEIKNNESIIKKITLADQSTVLLEPEAVLQYPKQFGNSQRAVKLQGEAFFDITKNPQKPFLIDAGQTQTKVLGTSFRIRAVEQESEVSVNVRTGKVAVLVPKTQKEVLLTPNQKAVYNKTTTTLKKTISKNPIQLEGTSLIFENELVSKIFDAIGKAYQLEIKYNKKSIATLRLTSTLTDEPFFDKLKIICAASGLNFSEKDGIIFIK